MTTPRKPATRAVDVPCLLQLLRRRTFETGRPVATDVARLIELIPDVSGAFPAGDARVVDDPADGRPARVVVSRGALTGPAKQLQPYWADVVRETPGPAGHALRGVLAALQLATLQAEDAATRAARPWDAREWATPAEGEPADALAAFVLRYLGPDVSAAVRRGGVPVDAIVRNFGLFLRPPTAEGLAVLLTDVFAVPVRVCRGKRGKKPALRLRVGPVPRDRFDQFRPDRETAPRFLKLARLYLGDGPRFDLEVQLRREDVNAADPDGLLPGWDFWGITPGSTPRRPAVARIPSWRCRRLTEDQG